MCPFWDIPEFSGIFPICPGTLRGFSRFVLFLFLGLLTAPTRNSLRKGPRHNPDLPEKSGKPPRLEPPPGLASLKSGQGLPLLLSSVLFIDQALFGEMPELRESKYAIGPCTQFRILELHFVGSSTTVVAYPS